MSSRLNISTPATLTVLSGTGTLASLALSSLADGPPSGISVSGATSGTLTVQVIAGNASAGLSASGLAGASISENANTLSITGTQTQVNAALASLELTEPGSAATDVLTLSASDPGFLATRTALAVDVIPLTGPAFVAPALIVTLQPNALDALPDLLLSDPIASGLAAIGLGQDETLTMTLAVASGVLFLPGFTDASAIAASGLGTGTITLNFTADDIAALNTLLAGLEFAGPAGGEHLDYALRNEAGVLPDVLTYGNIYLNIAGSAGANGTLAAGSQNLALGGATLAGTLDVTGTTAVLGDISGTGAVIVAPDASLELPYNALRLGGTSLDFGTIGATTLAVSGTLLDGDGTSLAGPVLLGAGASMDFTGTLVADGAATLGYQQALSLGAGAVLTGGGTLLAGNFSEAGLISGPGTLLAGGGETLLVAAGSVGGGTDLEVASGAVMLLGPVSPLYGVFDATVLTLDSSVTLSFANDAGSGVSGIYADTLGGTGGAFVINGPQAFSGTILGFAPGDQLIFPGLTDFNVFDVARTSFTVAGLDANNATDTYEIYASMAPGTTLMAGLDAEGDPDVMLRTDAASIMPLNLVFAASAGIAQPLQGLSLALITTGTQSLRLTLSAANGMLSDGTLGPAPTLTLTAMGVAAMNAELAGVNYTGSGLADTITLTGNSGILSGLTAYAAVELLAPGTVSGYAGGSYTEAQVDAYGAGGGFLQVTAAIAAGALMVASTTEFTDLLQVNGISGTALLVDDGATAMFNDGATVLLAQDITLGDATGAGTLAITGSVFSTSGNMTLTANPGGAGSAADVLGSLGVAGMLEVGAAGAAVLNLSGSLTAGAATLNTGGTIFAYGSAVADFGGITGAGTIILDNAATAQATSLLTSGALTLGGTASLSVGGLFEMYSAGATLQLGTDTTLQAGSIDLMNGIVSDAGTLAATGAMETSGLVTLGGGTISAATLIVSNTLQGDGVLDAGTLLNAGVILAQGGTLVLGGDIENDSLLEIGPAAALDVAGLLSGAALTFTGAGGLVTVDDPANFSAGFTDFSATDAIDLVGVAPSLVSYSGGTYGVIQTSDSLGNIISQFGIDIAAGQPALTVISDNAGGSLITLGDELPCFARGTGLLTPHGYRAVETLKPGDPLITAKGVRRPVRWIGRRTLDLGPKAARFARPVLIMPDAFGPGLPARMLRLSPLHCVYADGVLVPVTHLVNGATIRREDDAVAMTYYHVELDRHDILLAEGLPCESYFDAGNRSLLYHEAGRRSPARKSFAPSVTTGARLAKIRRRLHAVALVAGFSLTYWPTLRAVAAGQSVLPEIQLQGRWRMARFHFARDVQEITLLSGTACPADTDPDSEDRRELGVCVEASDALALGQGFYPRGVGDDGLWMGKAAALRLAQPDTALTLALAAIVQSWVKPPDPAPGAAVDAGARGG
jgi:hypothetical protein